MGSDRPRRPNSRLSTEKPERPSVGCAVTVGLPPKSPPPSMATARGDKPPVADVSPRRCKRPSFGRNAVAQRQAPDSTPTRREAAAAPAMPASRQRLARDNRGQAREAYATTANPRWTRSVIGEASSGKRPLVIGLIPDAQDRLMNLLAGREWELMVTDADANGGFVTSDAPVTWGDLALAAEGST